MLSEGAVRVAVRLTAWASLRFCVGVTTTVKAGPAITVCSASVPGLEPAALLATTEKLYGIKGASPVTSQLVDVVVVHVRSAPTPDCSAVVTVPS
jgi:hypothetical protein